MKTIEKISFSFCCLAVSIYTGSIVFKEFNKDLIVAIFFAIVTLVTLFFAGALIRSIFPKKKKLG